MDSRTQDLFEIVLSEHEENLRKSALVRAEIKALDEQYSKARQELVAKRDLVSDACAGSRQRLTDYATGKRP